MTIIRMVFENGVEICHNKNGKWFYISPEKNNNIIQSPSFFGRKYKLKPILETKYSYVQGEYSLLLSSNGQQYLELLNENIMQKAINKDAYLLDKICNFSYVIGSLIHHCKQLAQNYVSANKTFRMIYPAYAKASNNILPNQYDIYYEFDALITSALRSYDASRYIIWSTWETKQCPRSFENMLKNCNHVPVELKRRLENSWSIWGRKLKEYRDCIQHYIPLFRLIPSTRMVNIRDNVWIAIALIPDNPEVRSTNNFTYISKMDALKYSWELVNEIVHVAQLIFNALPDLQNIE